MKLKNKILMEMLPITIIPIIIITTFTYIRYANLVNRQISQISDNIFEKAENEANSAIESINYISDLLSLHSGSEGSILDHLHKFASADSTYSMYDVFKSNQYLKYTCQSLIFSDEYINGIYLFTPSGVTLGYANNNDIKNHYEPFEEDWYSETLALNGKTYISGISTKDYIINAKPSITFSKSLYDIYTGRFLGILVVDCSPAIFDLSTINSLPDSMLLAIENTQTGYILYSNADSLDNFKFQSNLQTKKTDLILDGLCLISTVNYDSLDNEFAFTQLLILVLAGVCILLYAAISIFISTSVAMPVSYLSDKIANRSGHNRVEKKQYLERSDEIGTLCNEYNTMLDELNCSIKNEYQNKLIALDSQMKSLEAQINSHFLYNTLESINSIAEIEEIDSIATMSLALGNMFRYSIKTESELVPISDELRHVKDYISIQRIRFEDMFELSVNISKQIQKVHVLKLILQPIVENALFHGLQFCNTGHTIKIVGYMRENCIYFEISDDGQGMSEEQLRVLKESLNEEPQFTELGQRNRRSIGLKNIHTRIELYYGRGYGLSISSERDIGTTVTICIPDLSTQPIL